MNIIVESVGYGTDDDFFKQICRAVIHDLKKQGFGKLFTEIGLSFVCQTQKLKGIPLNSVNVIHSPTNDSREIEFLDAMEASITKLGKKCRLYASTVLCGQSAA